VEEIVDVKEENIDKVQEKQNFSKL